MIRLNVINECQQQRQSLLTRKQCLKYERPRPFLSHTTRYPAAEVLVMNISNIHSLLTCQQCLM